MEIYDDEVAKKNSDRGFYSAAVIPRAYKIYEYVREARESEASVETLIEKAVEERTPKEPGSLCAFLKTC